jgi:hypothetical protein
MSGNCVEEQVSRGPPEHSVITDLLAYRLCDEFATHLFEIEAQTPQRLLPPPPVTTKPQFYLELNELLAQRAELPVPSVERSSALETVGVIPGAQGTQAAKQVSEGGQAIWELLAALEALPQVEELSPGRGVAGHQEELAGVRMTPALTVDRSELLVRGEPFFRLLGEELKARDPTHGTREVLKLTSNFQYQHLLGSERGWLDGCSEPSLLERTGQAC